jgi:hypothetical protein
MNAKKAVVAVAYAALVFTLTIFSVAIVFVLSTWTFFHDKISSKSRDKETLEPLLGVVRPGEGKYFD